MKKESEQKMLGHKWNCDYFRNSSKCNCGFFTQEMTSEDILEEISIPKEHPADKSFVDKRSN